MDKLIWNYGIGLSNEYDVHGVSGAIDKMRDIVSGLPGARLSEVIPKCQFRACGDNRIRHFECVKVNGVLAIGLDINRDPKNGIPFEIVTEKGK